MDFIECSTSRQIIDACNNFFSQLEAMKDQKAIEDTSSMFNSIRGAAATYDSPVGRKTRAKIWIAKNEHDQVVGLMRLKDEGTYYHLENLVGIPKAGGGAALLELTKAVAMSLGKELKLEAADSKLIQYYTERCFRLEKEGASGMVWKHDF